MYKISDSDYHKAWALSNPTIRSPIILSNFNNYIFIKAKHTKPCGIVQVTNSFSQKDPVAKRKLPTSIRKFKPKSVYKQLFKSSNKTQITLKCLHSFTK